jgi:hypothetical protein
MWESRRRGGFSLENLSGKGCDLWRNCPKTDTDFGMMWQSITFLCERNAIFFFDSLAGMLILTNCLTAIRTEIN